MADAPTARSTGARGGASRAIEPPIREVVVRWTITSGALPERFRPVAAPATDESVLAVRIASAGGPLEVSARLQAGGPDGAIELGAVEAVWRRDPETGLVHIDVPSVVSLTLRPARREEGAELLYARTPLLSRLGLAGGRYEPAWIDIRAD